MEAPIVNLIENAIRDGISKTPGINKISELDYCIFVLEALELVRFGVQMRLEELEAEDE